MRIRPALLLVLPVLAACTAARSVRYERPDLGVAAVFPEAPAPSRYSDPSPFGDIEWFAASSGLGGRMDQSFRIAVGNLPPGERGGTTPGEVLATYQRWMGQRLGTVSRTDLPGGKGPGFRYTSASGGRNLEGVVVVRRGRLHVAEAVTPKASDPRAAAFLASFEVAP